jgi:DNA-binding transcriptional regulator YiaG
MYHYTDGGLRNVWLANGYERVETPYGKALIIQDLPGLTRAICKALIRKNSKLTGAEFRYLRQAMLMSQTSLGRTLGRTDQAIAGWEKNSKVPKFADQMLRVVYAAHVDANEQVKI